jgi:hypothetical protein
MEWFGARTLYLHENRKAGDSNLYEERIVMIKANDFDEAIAKAESEAKEYVSDESEIKFLGFVSVFNLFEKHITDKTEVYSLMRGSKLNSDDYITAFFDTGTERSK